MATVQMIIETAISCVLFSIFVTRLYAVKEIIYVDCNHEYNFQHELFVIKFKNYIYIYIYIYIQINIYICTNNPMTIRVYMKFVLINFLTNFFSNIL